MKNVILTILFLSVCNFGFSQELPSDINYGFDELFEQIKNGVPVFVVTSSKDKNNAVLLFYKSQIIFPLVEEKQMMNFSEGTRQRVFTSTISFGNFHKNKLNFTVRSSYAQQVQGNQPKILKGYDYCLRPIY